MRAALGLALAAALACQAGVRRAEVAPEPAVSTYAAVIAPILAARCVACHGPEQVKGKLRLDTPAGILEGGDSGPAIAPGRPQESELLLRVQLPLKDSDHMPPRAKPQPSAAEIRALQAWIAAGAPFEGSVPAVVPPGEVPAERVLPLPPAGALEALRREFVHVQELEPGSNALWIDLASVAEALDDARLSRLLAPVRLQVVHLALARAVLTDRSASLLGSLENLRRLDLRDTAVGDATVAALARLERLEELVLARTRVGPGAVAHLEAMASLRSLHLWGTTLAADQASLARLRARGTLRVDAGDTPDSAASESEAEVTFTSDAPIDGPAKAASAPVNALCPVTKGPVSSGHVLEHEGEVVGFCCAQCPTRFLAEPERYPVPKP